MTPATLLLILVAFLAAIALVFVLAKALKNWVFELSPGTWVATIILTYALGALTVAYMDGNWNVVILAAVPIVIAIVWWVVKAATRGGSRAEAAEAS